MCFFFYGGRSSFLQVGVGVFFSPRVAQGGGGRHETPRSLAAGAVGTVSAQQFGLHPRGTPRPLCGIVSVRVSVRFPKRIDNT